MTAKTRKAIKKLQANVRRNAPRVRRKLTRNGGAPSAAAVYSVAKYYKTLEKLAKE